MKLPNASVMLYTFNREHNNVMLAFSFFLLKVYNIKQAIGFVRQPCFAIKLIEIILLLHFRFLPCPVSPEQAGHHFLESYFSYCFLCRVAPLGQAVSYLLLPSFITSLEVCAEME